MALHEVVPRQFRLLPVHQPWSQTVPAHCKTGPSHLGVSFTVQPGTLSQSVTVNAAQSVVGVPSQVIGSFDNVQPGTTSKSANVQNSGKPPHSVASQLPPCSVRQLDSVER